MLYNILIIFGERERLKNKNKIFQKADFELVNYLGRWIDPKMKDRPTPKMEFL